MPSDHPRNPFNQEATGRRPVSEEQDMPQILRDKDNAAPRVTPPPRTQYPAPNMAAPGAMGIRQQDRGETPQPETEEPRRVFVEGDEIENLLLIDGEWQGYKFYLRQEDEPVAHGIEGGRISRLYVTREDELLVCYNGEWRLTPDTPAERQLVHDLCERFNDTPRREFKPISSPSQDKDRDIER